MLHLSRPWDARRLSTFGRTDCLISEAEGGTPKLVEHSVLLRSTTQQGRKTELMLHPYPRKAKAINPLREGFPLRPSNSAGRETDEDAYAHELLRHMNEVLARVQELGEALDNPIHVWDRLGLAWERAENEEDPRMAEIVRQARQILPRLKELEPKIRRVLRRARELTPLDRVQEMDRASMRWLVRQPGRTIAERAGASQRIISTVRRESFDTPENRVVHAYTRLASDVAKEWIREHPKAKASKRYEQVKAFEKFCKMFACVLEELDVRIAEAGVTPNYVLMQDKHYHEVYEAWQRLLKEQKVLDDLWAWQAEAWTDFSVLAIVLALNDLEDAELIAQSPILWRDEAVLGRWFEQDRPIAVFWLKSINRVVEVQARPENPGSLLSLARAHVALRITDVNRVELQRRVAVWTPHALAKLDLSDAVTGANQRLAELQNISSRETLRHGLILTPAFGAPQVDFAQSGRTHVNGIALDASGDGLRIGLESIRAFARSEAF